jgi:hypothetical protein
VYSIGVNTHSKCFLWYFSYLIRYDVHAIGYACLLTVMDTNCYKASHTADVVLNSEELFYLYSIKHSKTENYSI